MHDSREPDPREPSDASLAHVRARLRDLVTEIEGVHARVVERTKRSSFPPPAPPPLPVTGTDEPGGAPRAPDAKAPESRRKA